MITCISKLEKGYYEITKENGYIFFRGMWLLIFFNYVSVNFIRINYSLSLPFSVPKASQCTQVFENNDAIINKII